MVRLDAAHAADPDDVVVVAEPDLASLRNAKNIVDLIRAARPNDAPPRVVLNKVGVPGRPEIPVKDFGEALGLEPSAVHPFDAKLFGQAANNGQMIAELAPKSKTAEGLRPPGPADQPSRGPRRREEVRPRRPVQAQIGQGGVRKAPRGWRHPRRSRRTAAGAGGVRRSPPGRSGSSRR